MCCNNKVYHTHTCIYTHTYILGRTRHRRKGNIKMNIKEIWLEGVDWINLAQNMDRSQAVVNMIMKLKVS
jgi:hypothetical protein